MANIRVSELDFDGIKTNLKDYLKAQSEFSDFDFEGSAMSVLLDILAYNTHYNSYYLNMIMNEFFMDSALKRESATSIAKHLNYMPRSRLASKFKVNITVNGVSPGTEYLTLERYTRFRVEVLGAEGYRYYFVNLEPHTIVPVNGQYVFNDIELTEGFVASNIFTVTTPGTSEKFVLTNKNIDTNTLKITVQNSETDLTLTTYSRVEDITGITGESNAYFLELNQFGFYEIFFGDGNVGRKLVPGNIILAEYLVTVGDAADVSGSILPENVFVDIQGNINGYTETTIGALSVPSGGDENESLSSIKFNAPRNYTAQNRAVTSSDYETIIKKSISDVEDITIWGGEENVPPQYGKVFISIVPSSGTFITNTLRDRITDTILSSKRVVSLTPEIIEPEFYFVNVSTTVKYNTRETNLSSAEIRNLADAKVRQYFEDNLGSFNERFTYSKLLAAIDSADLSIVGNNTVVKIQKRFKPSLTLLNNDKFIFNNILQPDTVETTRFYVNINDEILPARIRDEPDAATVLASGTFRRNGTLITISLEEAHGLTKGEEVELVFDNNIDDGTYEIYDVPTEKTFLVISTASGTVAGTVDITSKPRGTLIVFNPVTGETLKTNVGFINYNEGIVQFNQLAVYGFADESADIKITIGLEESSKDIEVVRNQIIRLDDSTSDPEINKNAGLTVNVTEVAI